jgi:hypothetical protein
MSVKLPKTAQKEFIEVINRQSSNLLFGNSIFDSHVRGLNIISRHYSENPSTL